MYEFQGKIHKVSSVIPVTGKYKEKCTVIVRNDKRDTEIAFVLFDQQIYDTLQPLEIGDEVSVTFVVKSREYQGQYTTNCFVVSLTVVQTKKDRENTNNYGKNKYRTGGYANNNSGKSDWQKAKEESEHFKKEEWERIWEEFTNRFSGAGHSAPPPPKSDNYFTGIHNKEDAKKRYRELCKKYHPDMVEGSTEKMQKINEQYEIWR